MEMQHQPHFDWPGDTLTALRHPNTEQQQQQQRDHQQQQDKWVAALSGPGSTPSQGFFIPPALLTHATIERYGQVTPPEELSPADARHDEREGSIPVEQLRNETPFWPKQEPSPLDMAPPPEPSPKRRRTSHRTSANQDTAASSQPINVAAATSSANPQPAKRKRGRPKSQPQMVEAYTADGYPFHVSSARQTHLEKNRVAAHKCRQRKKEYINGLEGRAREFSAKNKMLKENVALLREEVLGLKNEVLRHAGCGFWAVDEYLARCAGDLLGMEAPNMRINSASTRHPNTQQSPAISTSHLTDQQARATSMGSISSDDFGGLELLKDFTDEDMDDMEA
ncbi:hypothetical protein BDW02DRAFT_571023 [Decorospora gaudefroyi]|uniref:BZIP domain-containing protein n=1 Tax=Decorospora gaudefroyi TaxID=184978 RepID=A0A6A5KDF6_9PLEO|nr:hypothetical protein BDW02DRAFT_571023 [Decorospora gaudefroyi]